MVLQGSELDKERVHPIINSFDNQQSHDNSIIGSLAHWKEGQGLMPCSHICACAKLMMVNRMKLQLTATGPPFDGGQCWRMDDELFMINVISSSGFQSFQVCPYNMRIKILLRQFLAYDLIKKKDMHT